MKDDYNTNSCYTTYAFCLWKVERMYFLSSGVKGSIMMMQRKQNSTSWYYFWTGCRRAGVLSLMWSICVQYIVGTVCGWIVFLMSSGQGCDKTPVCLPGASEFLCRTSRSPWQLARGASKVQPKTLKKYTFIWVTSHYDIWSSLEDNCFLLFTVRQKRTLGKWT